MRHRRYSARIVTTSANSHMVDADMLPWWWKDCEYKFSYCGRLPLKEVERKNATRNLCHRNEWESLQSFVSSSSRKKTALIFEIEHPISETLYIFLCRSIQAMLYSILTCKSSIHRCNHHGVGQRLRRTECFESGPDGNSFLHCASASQSVIRRNYVPHRAPTTYTVPLRASRAKSRMTIDITLWRFPYERHRVFFVLNEVFCE